MADLFVLVDRASWYEPVEGGKRPLFSDLRRGDKLPEGVPAEQVERLKSLGAVGEQSELRVRRSVGGGFGPIPVWSPTSPESAVKEARDDGSARHTAETLRYPVPPGELAQAPREGSGASESEAMAEEGGTPPETAEGRQEPSEPRQRRR